MKVIIIGGVAGGATAAARIRRLDEKAQITIYENTNYISYANCGLPYYIGDVIEEENKLTLQSPEKMYARYRVDVKVSHQVEEIVADKKEIKVKNLTSGEVFTDTYDYLILSPGAKAFMPDIPAAEDKEIFTLKNVEDTLLLDNYIAINKPKKTLLIGGGYINLEIAENLINKGLDVTLIQRGKGLLRNVLDPDMGELLNKTLTEKGLHLKLGHTISEEDTKDADIIVVGAGSRPRTELAIGAGLELGEAGGIKVDDRMRTSDPYIYAVGDAVETRDRITGKERLAYLAAPANKEARIAADNICGLESHYKGSIGVSVLKVFDLTVAMLGLTEDKANKLGYDYGKVLLTPPSHASYYPGSSTVWLKLIYEKKTCKILGAQIIGKESIDKRIDVLAVAVQASMSALDLKDLDLAYAPPFNAAKDPVNLAAFMIEDLENGLVKQFFKEDLDKILLDEKAQVIDVRSEKEFEKTTISGSKNIPLDSLRERLNEIDKEKPVYLFCKSGIRSYIATRILMANGYEASHLAGGYAFYSI